MSRDPARPLPEIPCGYALADDGSDYCGQPSVYTFRMADWPASRVGNVCPEHALIVRRWDGVETMR